MTSKRKRVVLAYSGGLDTSVAIPWIRETYDADVIALTVDLGQGRELDGVRQKALDTGAVKAVVVDGKEAFFHEFVWPALQAGAIYEALERLLSDEDLRRSLAREGSRAVERFGLKRFVEAHARLYGADDPGVSVRHNRSSDSSEVDEH